MFYRTIVNLKHNIYIISLISKNSFIKNRLPASFCQFNNINIIYSYKTLKKAEMDGVYKINNTLVLPNTLTTKELEIRQQHNEYTSQEFFGFHFYSVAKMRIFSYFIMYYMKVEAL